MGFMDRSSWLKIDCDLRRVINAKAGWWASQGRTRSRLGGGRGAQKPNAGPTTLVTFFRFDGMGVANIDIECMNFVRSSALSQFTNSAPWFSTASSEGFAILSRLAVAL